MEEKWFVCDVTAEITREIWVRATSKEEAEHKAKQAVLDALHQHPLWTEYDTIDNDEIVFGLIKQGVPIGQ